MTRFELEKEIKLPNITIERKYVNDVHKAYRLTANDGYSLHSPSLDTETEDPMTGEKSIERYYPKQATVNVVQPVETWDWHAVLETDVPADQIFSGGNNDHKVM